MRSKNELKINNPKKVHILFVATTTRGHQKFGRAAPQILIYKITDDEKNNPDQVFCGVVIDEKRL